MFVPKPNKAGELVDCSDLDCELYFSLWTATHIVLTGHLHQLLNTARLSEVDIIVVKLL